MSGLSGGNSRDLEEQEGTATSGIRMEESMSTDWTDEKHSLYLNSIEALFVKQLYNHDYSPMEVVSKNTGKENWRGPNSLRQSGSNIRMSSGQFKVLRGGCWQKINFERDQSQQDTANDSSILLKNPWIRHFKQVGKRQDVLSPHAQQNGELCRKEAITVRGEKTSSCELATGSKQLPMHHLHLCYQDSVDSNAEMSDQNFVDEDHEKEKFNILNQTKRLKTVCDDASSKDQVVPLGKSSSNDKCDSLEKERLHGDQEE